LITSIAHDHGKSATQVVLRWHVQLGLVVIPRSSNPGRRQGCERCWHAPAPP
jgi:2,5-diketo-D-gluconate reductase A